MKHKKFTMFVLVVVLVLLLAGCSLARPPQNGGQVDQGAIDTQVAQTMAAVSGGQQNDGSGGGDDTGSNAGGDTGGNTGGDQPPAPTDTQAPPPPTDTPEPTATFTNTPTATIEPTLPLGIADLNLGGPDRLFAFDNSSGVYVFGGNDNKAEVKDGTYQFTMVSDLDYTVWSFPFAVVIEDYYFEVAITMPNNCVGKDRAGIIFGTPDGETDNGANFQISCDGHYRLWIYDGNDTINLINWTSSDELFSGPNKTNKIGVMHRGNKITLYINGALVDQVTDNTYVGPGRIGFNIGVDDHNPVTFYFDNAAYWTHLP